MLESDGENIEEHKLISDSEDSAYTEKLNEAGFESKVFIQNMGFMFILLIIYLLCIIIYFILLTIDYYFRAMILENNRIKNFFKSIISQLY